MFEVIVILIIASGVLYYLYNTLKEYLSNENNQKRFLQDLTPITEIAYQEPTLEDKIRASEYGILSGILGYVANADGEICILEQRFAESMLEDMAKEMHKMGDFESILELLKTIFFETDKNIQILCEGFCELTKGEYKKKLKVVEFCFVLGYADGTLNKKTKEAILDVGALLELDNQDFNALYEDFAKENQLELSLDEAKAIFGDTQDDLDKRYLELVSEAKQNFIDEEKLHSFDGKNQLLSLQKIHAAYQILKQQ